MKKHIFRITGMLFLAVLAVTQATQAQERVAVNVPFDFNAGNTKLPAGEYVVGKSDHIATMLKIERADGTAAILVPSNAAESNASQSESKLVFHKYGDRYFLSQVWTAGSARGRELMKSAAEKEVALSARIDKPEQVTLFASLISPK